MKHLKRISLHNLSQAELSKREENLLRGGEYTYDASGPLPCACIVGCTCLYEGEKEGPDDAYYGGASKEISGGANGDSYQSSGDISF